MIGKGRKRVMITLHNETLNLLNELKALHKARYTNSNLIEIALMYYTDAIISRINKDEGAIS